MGTREQIYKATELITDLVHKSCNGGGGNGGGGGGPVGNLGGGGGGGNGGGGGGSGQEVKLVLSTFNQLLVLDLLHARPC